MNITNKNFLCNLVYQLISFLIPLVTVPYISRVLGADNIGIYAFTYSIVNYFMLASMLGINNYGTREIAIRADDINTRSKKFFSIYFLQLILTGTMSILFVILTLIFNYEYKLILLIQGINILSCAFDINWYFFGMENFKITISRNIIIKLISLLLIFMLVKSKSDLWIYTMILSLSTMVSQVYLWIFLKKEVKFVKVNIKEITSNLLESLILFIPVVAYSIYRITDKTMIGMMSGINQLGNYESAEKIINIPLCIISALGMVMLPHMSKTTDDELPQKITDVFKLCYFMLFPIFVGLLIVSKDFTTVFFGSGFELTSILICSLSVTILFSGMTNIIRNNYLIPKGKEKIYVMSTIFGAVINLILNFMAIPQYGAFGATISTIISEFIVMMYQIVGTWRDIDYLYNLKLITPFLFKSFVMGLIVYIIGILINQSLILKLLIQIVMGIIIYILLNIKYILTDFIGMKNKYNE